MKNSKLILIISMAVVLLSAACTEEEGALYQNPSNETLVSFESSKYIADLTPDDGTEILVKMTRNQVNGTFEVPVVLESSSNLFTLENPIFHFNDGEAVAYQKILFPGAAELEIGVIYTLKLKLAVDSLVTEGGISTQIFTLNRKLTWISLGNGQWTDGIVCTIFSVPAETYEVEVQEAEESPGLYRLVNLYGLDVYPYTEATDIVRNPSYLLINAIDSDNVTVSGTSVGEGFGLGIDYSYGEFFIGIPSVGVPGTKIGNTIIFPAGASLKVGMLDYTAGELEWFCNECKLVLP